MKLNGIVLSEKKEKTVPKGYILHDSIYMAFLKRQNYKDGERFYCHGWGRRKRREVGYGYKMVPLGMLVLEAIYMITGINMW